MPKKDWTFISSHGAVLALIARNQQITAKQLADTIGLTERPVRKIIADLEEHGYIQKTKVGTANHYTVNRTLPLRNPAAREIAVGDLIDVLRLKAVQD